MVDVFLLAERNADPDNFDLTLKHGSPSWAEKRSIAALALRLRVADPTDQSRPAVRSAALGQAVYGLMIMLSATAIINAAGHVMVALWPPTSLDASLPLSARLGRPLFAGVSQTISSWAYLAWIPALACALRGGRAGMTAAAGFAAIPTIVTGVTSHGSGYLMIDRVVSAAAYAAVTATLIMLAVAAVPIRLRRMRVWLAAAAAAVLLVIVVQAAAYAAAYLHLTEAGAQPTWWMVALVVVFVDDIGLWCWAVAVALLVAATVKQRPRADPGPAPGLALLAGTVAILRLSSGLPVVSAALHADVDPYRAWWIAATVSVLAQSVLMALVAIVCTVRARRLTRPESSMTTKIR